MHCTTENLPKKAGALAHRLGIVATEEDAFTILDAEHVKKLCKHVTANKENPTWVVPDFKVDNNKDQWGTACFTEVYKGLEKKMGKMGKVYNKRSAQFGDAKFIAFGNCSVEIGRFFQVCRLIALHHPDWTPKQVMDEAKKIIDERVTAHRNFY